LVYGIKIGNLYAVKVLVKVEISNFAASLQLGNNVSQEVVIV